MSQRSTQHDVARQMRKRAIRTLRALAGNDSRLEQLIRRRRRTIEVVRNRNYTQWNGRGMMVVQSKDAPEPKTGIFLRGACDLATMFKTGGAIAPEIKGTLAMLDSARGISDARVDVLLQSLSKLPAEVTAEAVDRLSLWPDYFRPTLFEPTFSVPGMSSLGDFPKTVVVLSIAPNLVRRMYRHREHGYLADPGGWWLNQSMDVVLEERERVAWFRENFEPIGRLDVDEFKALFATLIEEVRRRTGAHVIVYNALTVEPGDRTHNYQLRAKPEGQRRRACNLALIELSRELGFHVVDVDRALKREGIQEQLDFAHFPSHRAGAIADEALRILKELEVV